MSLFGAIGIAISGLTAGPVAFGNNSEYVANTQTVDFKRVDTNSVDALTTSTPTDSTPGAIVAYPNFVNNIRIFSTQTNNPLGLAIVERGFFAVSQPIGQTNDVVPYNRSDATRWPVTSR
jgi:flagellar hook protein FlgE